jgi:hypothetical protein
MEAGSRQPSLDLKKAILEFLRRMPPGRHRIDLKAEQRFQQRCRLCGSGCQRETIL